TGIGPSVFCSRLRPFAGGQKVIGVSYFFDSSFDDCRRDVIAAVERACPSDNPRQTVEVDVIGLSLGGVVGRYSALERPGEKRLRIHRLFTVSSPHRGAIAAPYAPELTHIHHDLREGSTFLRNLEQAEAWQCPYEIVPYVRLGDWIVGARDAAPFGQEVWG